MTVTSLFTDMRKKITFNEIPAVTTPPCPALSKGLLYLT